MSFRMSVRSDLVLHCARLATAASSLALAACIGSGDGTAPLDVRLVNVACAKPVDTLIVLLPGAYDHADDFIKEGFVDALRSRGIAADVALADASIAYYKGDTIVERLDHDVVEPARSRGIRHFWFAGISLGGLGDLIYANQRGGAVDGLLLIAPYLGDHAIAAEVAAAGGVRRWMPPRVVPPEDDDRRLWKWLKTLTQLRNPDAGQTDLPQVWLGYGREDRFADAHRLLAAALPPGHAVTEPGGHDWPPWRALWNDLLDSAPLPRDPSCKPAP
jgi:hypothetical protein